MSLRGDNIDRLDGGTFDVAIVGGGINGAVSAAALAGRGLRVALLERNDFASFTSQESSNLVWGGFKYLENYELPLVFALCRSRNRLMKAYPTSITELRFLATLDASAPFPPWLAGIGTLGYWAIGQFATKPPRYRRPRSLQESEPIIDTSTASAGIEYADAYLKDNDARFVWGFVRSALDLGATAANYTTLSSAERSQGQWRIEALDTIGGRRLRLTATAMVNAAGPFVDQLNADWGVTTDHRIVYSKGIHLVVPRLTDSERVLAFFDDTQRLFYVIPMAHRSVIGTTDTRTTDPHEAITDDDRTFLLSQLNARLRLDRPLTVDDIIAERSGVRPLVVANDGDDRTDIDWTSLSRKHEIEVDRARQLVTVFGGKLTDCLNVGEEVVDALAGTGVEPGPERRWYGEPPTSERRAFLGAATGTALDRPPDVERERTLAHVMWRRHGRAAGRVLRAVVADPTQAEPILPESDVLRAEIPLYAEREMVMTLDDFLRRRTKLAMLHRPETLAAAESIDELKLALAVTG